MARFYHSVNVNPSGPEPGWKRLTVHLGQLPDGTLAGTRMVELADTGDRLDGRVIPLPRRLFFDVETNDGLIVVVDSDIPDDGLPVAGYPGSVAVKAVTFSAADGSDLELKHLNEATVPEEWVFQAFAAAAMSYSGAGPITVDFGADTPEGYPDPTAGREMVRRLLKMKGVRRGPPEASRENVVRAGELAEVGWSLREIANDLGVSKSTAGRYVQKAKVRKGQE
jgi:hypothetical protein